MRGKVRRVGVFVGLLGLVFLIGCSGGSDEKKPPAGTGTKPGDTVARKRTSPPADVTLTAAQLGEELKKDPQGTLNKYLNKRVDISGVVHRAGRASAKENYLEMKSGSPAHDITFWTTDPEPWKHALPGQTATVTGTVRMLGASLQVSQCEVVEVSGAPPPTLSADELAKEYTADPKATDAKYHRKGLIVTGEVAEFENKNNFSLINLKTSSPTPRVKYSFYRDSWDFTKDFKPGQTIKMLVEYHKGKEDDEQFKLMPFVPLEVK